MANKSAEKDRKARLEEVRKQQAGVQRRRTVLVAGAAAVLVLGLGAAVTTVALQETASHDLANVGVTAAAAGCDPATNDPTSGSSVHVGPGTDKPTVSSVKYATVPPSSGEHFATPQYPARSFYTATDRPVLETLVHNLEHGYTVLWYTSALPQAQIDQLKKIGDLALKEPGSSNKFIVSAWDDAHGAFPAGKTIGISHWGAKQGHRELCSAVSGEVVKKFVAAYPSTDAPEPNGT